MSSPIDRRFTWPPTPLPGRMVDGVLLVSPAELKQMKDAWGEYSCSIPSGVYPGKRWLRDRNSYPRDRSKPEDWLMGQYEPDDVLGEERCKITWTPVRLDPEVLAVEVNDKLLEATP